MRERAVSMAARLEAPGDDDPGVTRARKLALLRGHNATTTAPFAYPDGINDAPLECLYDEWEWEQRESTAVAKRASDAARRETLDTFVAERKVSLVGARRRPLAAAVRLLTPPPQVADAARHAREAADTGFEAREAAERDRKWKKKKRWLADAMRDLQTTKYGC